MIDLSQLYALEMMRKRRLRNTVREDYAFEITTTGAGETFTFRLIAHSGGECLINWGDNSSSTFTGATLSTLSHVYATAGTYQISITGDLMGVRHSANMPTKVTKIVNMNLPGYVGGYNDFYLCSNADFHPDFRLHTGITLVANAFWNSGVSFFPDNFKLPSALTSAQWAFRDCSKLAGKEIPLRIWPTAFSAGAIIFTSMMTGMTLGASVIPSQILWDSGKTFTIDVNVFGNNRSSFLNYAAAYTDPVSGITYSKIPYAWGGAAD
jgi:hypothetical protein